MSATSSSSYEVPRIPMPMDDNEPQYTKSFTMEQHEEYKQFFNEYGFVVIRDVLNSQQVEATVNDIYDYLESGIWRLQSAKDQSEFKQALLQGKKYDRYVCKLKRNDKRTWENMEWPMMAEEGILGIPAVLTKQAFLNRVNENVYNVFSEITGDKKLWVNIDRYGFFRPTKQVVFESFNPPEDRKQWKSFRNVHFDRNPWKYFDNDAEVENESFPSSYDKLVNFCVDYNSAGRYNDGIVKLQGLINLQDNLAEDGGFHIVPGFHKYAKQWAESTADTVGKYRNGSFIIVPKAEPLGALAQRVTMRPGSIVVWDIIMPHGSAPNDSSRSRMAQFIKMFKAPDQLIPGRSKVIEKAIEETETPLTELGEKILGLKEW
jgi:ectoine hydroxylase-related dioxygenase (phytanoyl-CoA dioxygenase family)